MKKKVRFLPDVVGVVLVLLFIWTKDIRLFLFKSTIIAYLLLLIGVALVVCGTVFRGERNYTFHGYEILWMLALIPMWCGEVGEGTFSHFFQMTVIVILLLLFAPSRRWVNGLLKSVIVISTVYAIVTLVSLVFRQAYMEIVVPMILPELRTEMVAQFNSGRIPGMTAHYSTNAIYLGLGSGIMMTYFYTCRRLKLKEIILTLVSFAALLITGKRAHTVFCLTALIFTYYIYMSNKKRGRIIKIVLTLAFILFALVVVGQFVPDLMNVAVRMQEQILSGDIFTGRLTFYERALDLFKENVLFGAGWRYNICYFGQDVHNVYLQLLSETGICGFVLFMILFFGTLFQTMKNLKNLRQAKKVKADRGAEVLLSISLFIQFFFLQYCFTGNPLYDEQTFFPYAMACAISYGYQYYRRPNKKIARVVRVGDER